uniref:Reverse transcriptase Ty1/copia-type domain-containing protein n=1 Tax=Fagus sylvatica TaxID=28930 RepID=A0A2N9I2X8_FAGSY
MVVGKSSSQEVWNTLEERFTSTARSNVLNLKLELQSIKKAGNETVSSYLQRIKTVRDKLSAVGVHSDHEELTHVILKGLPKEFAPFASAIRTQRHNPFLGETHCFNRGRGRNSYSRGRGGGGRNSSFHQGFSSPNASTQYHPQYQQQQINSSAPQGSQTTFQGKSERPTCQICWKIGHYAIDCYHRMNFAYQGKNPTTKLAAMASASNLHYTQNTESWLTDTGATDHITANANNLSPQAPYQGQEQVSVGNGQNLPIQNIGFTYGEDSLQRPYRLPPLPIPQNPMCLLYPLSLPTRFTDHPAPTPTTHASPLPANTVPNTIPDNTTSTDIPIPTVVSHPMQTRSKSGIYKPKLTYAAIIDYAVTEPTSYTVASKHSSWCTAMDEEFQALQKQNTWSLVPLPSSKNVVGCKWVYKLKTHSDGTIARYKARLVAKGFHQQHGIDFNETFSPVIKPPTVRLVLSLAVSLNWPLRQLDVKNAFLHGTLNEEVYMTQPQGYIDPIHPHYVCKLQKSIYGLKQGPRAWFESFTTQLLHLGFIASNADSSLFIYTENKIIAYLLLYVDDIVLTNNTPTFLDTLIHKLSSVFDLKELGSLHYFLGLQITRTPSRLYINQAKYAQDLLKKHNMLDCKPASSPSCPNTRLSLHDGDPLPDPHAYRSMVGALHYLTFTRPDISFAVHQMIVVPHLGFLSTWATMPSPGQPRNKQLSRAPLLSLSIEPLAIASAELCWVRSLLKDLGIYLSDPPILWCDNVSTLAIASNPVFHARTKHIEVDFHFVRERVLRKDLVVKFVSTVDQLADIFTKSLSTHRFLELRRNLTVTVPKIEGGC